MAGDNKFDDIRPYTDSEIPAAMARIAANASFPLLASYVFPYREVSEVRKMLLDVRTTDEFQEKVMYHMNERIIERTMTSFTFGGLENLSGGDNYLFVGNHRDIVLDSSLMQNVLLANGHTTSEITFGANLMQTQLLVDIGKSNKMFKVERPGGDMRDFYRASLHLSEYIRNAVCRNRHSVWIAQRNGRTKNGDDQTDQGIIKMFGMSGGKDKMKAIADLNIVPVAVSYEWEPCDVLKTLELYERRQMKHYVKKPGEDVNSILTGIVQPKGRVHIEFCRRVAESDIVGFAGMPSGEFNRAVAKMIDLRIHSAYRLYPNNYIACDISSVSNVYASRYTAEERQAFEMRLGELDRYAGTCSVQALRDIFLGIYSNPVINKAI